MFDNRIFPLFIFYAFDWLLTANVENASATKNRHPHCLADGRPSRRWRFRLLA